MLVRPVKRDALGAALRERVDGEVLEDARVLDRYATAACIYRIPPRAVVWPRHTQDVAETLRLASSAGVPVTARGAGSGVAGQPLSTGIVLDLSIHLRRIEIDSAAGGGAADAGAGATLASLRRRLAPLGRVFGPDPSSGEFCTLGGMYATNASGPHCPRDGSMREWVESVEAVLADGTVVSTEAGSPAARRLAESAAALAREGREALEAERPATAKDSSAYALAELAAAAGSPGPVELTRLLCGSEGTLAVVTNLRLRTEPQPAGAATIVLGFRSVQAACAAIVPLWMRAADRPAAAELLPAEFLAGSQASDGALPGVAAELAGLPALLLVEWTGRSPEDAGERAARSAREMRAPGGPAAAVVGPGGADLQQSLRALWDARRTASPTMRAGSAPGRRPLRFVEDAAVPPELLAEYAAALEALLLRGGLSARPFGHAASGHLHLNPSLDPADDAEVALLERIAEEHARLVRSFRGTLSGEHGDGRLRAPLLPASYPRSFPYFRRLKSLFDPEGVLNPGTIVPSPGAHVAQSIDRGPRADLIESAAARRRFESAVGAPIGNGSRA